MRSFQVVVILTLAGLTAVASAHAQGIPGGHGAPTPAGGGKAPDRPAPPAIPGAQSRPDAAAPADRAAADLPPTEALFDAINRGDLMTAKDAISRGANLEGRNLLGLSPLELSVDLARNDISFLLLSLRGGSDSSRGPASAQAAPSASPAPPQRRFRGAPVTASTARLVARRPGVDARSSSATGRQAPPLFAGNGGTPQPNVGFLGFDARP